jgi:hypothetical protein
VAAVLVALSVGRAFQTRNVFIVNIDGLRCNEGFEAGDQNIPFIWDSLRPLATTYTSFYNTGITVTGAAHPTILTGVRQLLVNNDGICSTVRPREPTIFECFRRATGAPQSQAVFIDGKSQTCTCPVSIWPGYGSVCGPQMVYCYNQNDIETWDSTLIMLYRNQPRLCYVLFAQVDAAGHTGDTATYLSAIRQADSLTFELWKRLRSNPHYRDSTTFIITSDHGRHDDRHGGWKDHGCACHGCRHILFMALGPDIKADTIIADRTDQIDIAPTVAQLLDFDMPYAQGRVLNEMLRTPQTGTPIPPGPNLCEQNLSQSTGLSRCGDIQVTASALHCVFADNSNGVSEIRYTRSPDRGTCWSTPRAVLSTPGVEYADPVLAALDDSTLLLAATAIRWVPDETTCVWVLRSTRSTDAGLTWQPETELDSIGLISCRPAIRARGNRVELAYLREHVLVALTSRDRGLTFSALETVSCSTPHYPEYPTLTLGDTTAAVAWNAIVPTFSPDSSQYRNVWFDRMPWTCHRVLVTHNGPCSYSREPSMDGNPDLTLHLAYADLPDATMGNKWTVAYRRNTGIGSGWSNVQHLDTAHVGFQPVIRQSDNGKLFCLCTTFDAYQWYISGACSDDSGLTWSGPMQLTDETDCASQPHFAVSGDTCFVVWEDRSSGNWEIMYESTVFSPTGVAETRRVLPLTLRASPNPFRTRTAISLQLTADSHTEVAIFDATGRRVRTMTAPRSLPPGPHSLSWTGTDDRGCRLPAGVYTCVLSAGNRTTACRLLLTN